MKFIFILITATMFHVNLFAEDIHTAALKGDVVAIQKLISQGVKIDERNRGGMTALHVACGSNKIDVVKFLLNKGAAVNAVSKKKDNCLRFTGDAAIVKLLLDEGIDVNNTNVYGETPLHRQARRLKIVKLLVEKGANVNVRDKNGRTPLHNAAEDFETVKYLVEHGAKIDIRDNNGETPIMRAISNRVDDKPNNIETIKYFLSKGANINDKNRDGETLLHKAGWFGRTETSKYLLGEKAKNNIKNQKGQTPSMVAEARGYTETAEFLKQSKSVSAPAETPKKAENNPSSAQGKLNRFQENDLNRFCYSELYRMPGKKIGYNEQIRIKKQISTAVSNWPAYSSVKKLEDICPKTVGRFK